MLPVISQGLLRVSTFSIAANSVSNADMAKLKTETVKKVAHPHLHARLAFLQRAAHLLEEQQLRTQLVVEPTPRTGNSENLNSASELEAPDLEKEVLVPSIQKSNPLAREMSSHTIAIIKKTKLRISPDLKRTICKRCSSKLIEGQSSFTRTENKSRDGRKAWAEVVVVTCQFCEMEKRIPLGQKRGRKKDQRSTKAPQGLGK